MAAKKKSGKKACTRAFTVVSEYRDVQKSSTDGQHPAHVVVNHVKACSAAAARSDVTTNRKRVLFVFSGSHKPQF